MQPAAGLFGRDADIATLLEFVNALASHGHGVTHGVVRQPAVVGDGVGGGVDALGGLAQLRRVERRCVAAMLELVACRRNR